MDIFKLLGTIAIENAEANRALEETSAEGERTHSKLDSAFKKMGSAAEKWGGKIVKAADIAVAAFATLTVKSLDLVGELEQNMGGSVAVFDEYAGKMQAIAETAYTNMGLSVSDYLATANKMGALFKGAGFEVQEASDLTAKAMQRAADVASIMGIDVSTAMESIAGAAKGNFTMMDNLGVAMNDTNLQAYALSKGIKTATSEMTTQEKVGLAMKMFLEKTAYATGNYAKENETLSGSLTTAKAAVKNFLSGAGDADEMLDALSDTTDIILDKLGDLLPRSLTGLGSLFKKLVFDIDGVVVSTGALYSAFRLLLKGNWIGGGISLAISALYALKDSHQDTIDSIQGVTEAERELMEAAKKSAQALTDAQAVRDASIPSIENETKKTRELADELSNYVRENGTLIEMGYAPRVEYILNELNDALGTEYKLNGDIISQYQQMQDEIDILVEKRRAESLLAAEEDSYASAYANYAEQVSQAARAQEAFNTAQAELDAFIDSPGVFFQQNEAAYIHHKHTLEEAVSDALSNYNDLAKGAQESLLEIQRYEEAYGLFQEGEYAESANRLTNDIVARWEHADDVKAISEAEIAELQAAYDKQLRDTEWYRQQFEAGVAGFSKPMLEDMEKTLDDLGDLLTKATAEATEAGENFGEGFASGVESMVGRAIAAAQQVANKALAAFNRTLEIASPSRATKRSGKFFDMGAAEGIEENADIMVSAAENASWKTLRAFEQGSPDMTATVSTAGYAHSTAEAESDGGYETGTQATPERLADVLAQVLPDILIEAFASMRFDINNREFARLVKAVN